MDVAVVVRRHVGRLETRRFERVYLQKRALDLRVSGREQEAGEFAFIVVFAGLPASFDANPSIAGRPTENAMDGRARLCGFER